MTTEWRITQKPDFFKALLALPPKETHQVLEKINLLAHDPTPDAKVKKQLKYMGGKLHRIRSGNYPYLLYLRAAIYQYPRPTSPG